MGRVLSRAGVDAPTHVVHLDEQAVAQLLDLLERRPRLGPFLLGRLDQRKDGAELRVDRGVLRVEGPVHCRLSNFVSDAPPWAERQYSQVVKQTRTFARQTCTPRTVAPSAAAESPAFASQRRARGPT